MGIGKAMWVLAAVAGISLFVCAGQKIAHASPACPSNLPGSIAFAGTNGLILCRSGRTPIVVTPRTDATAIAFSHNASRLQFRSAGAFHVYDIGARRDEIVPDPAPYCPEPLPMCTRTQRTTDGHWLLQVKAGAAQSNGLPGPATLLASNGALSVQVHASDDDDLDLAGTCA